MHGYNLNDLLFIFNLSKSCYNYHKNNIDKDKDLKDKILKIFESNKSRYGYRRIDISLRNDGLIVNHKKILRLMNELNIKAKSKKQRKYNSYKGEVGKIADNIIHRDFKTNKPYNKLFTDVTEFKIGEEKVYLSPIIDSYNFEILSYNISTSPNLIQTFDMLNKLYKILPKNLDYKTYLHSDQGWQYQQKQYQKSLKEHNIIQSMSRKGNCLDNCIVEGFFGKLKNEFYYGEEFKSIEEFIIKLNEYIEYYNYKRIKTALRTSPVDYRLRNTV